MSEINKSGVESIYLNKPVVSRRLVVRMFVFALFLASAYFIINALQQPANPLNCYQTMWK